MNQAPYDDNHFREINLNYLPSLWYLGLRTLITLLPRLHQEGGES